jgi:prepilin-type N-terminal cleavage/methylation domain-containing protein
MHNMNNQKNKNGFTLVELIVSMGIISFLMIAVITFQVSFLRNTATVQSGLIAQQQVRKTFSIFVQEVRTAGPSASSAFAIAEAGTSTFTFYSNIDADSDIERVKYFLGTSTTVSRTELYKQVINPAGGVYANANQELATMVQNIAPTTTPLFTYYDSSYAGTTTPLVQPVTTTAVRLIRVALPVDPNSARSPVFQTYTTQVSVRNLKDNL